MRVWDVATGQFVHELRGHTGNVIKMVVTPCGQHLISASWDGTVRMWDLATGQLRHTVECEPRSIRDVGLAPDGTVLVATVKDTDVVLWRVLPLDGV